MFLFQGALPASSSPLLGITLTPVPTEVQPTNTPVATTLPVMNPTSPSVVNTLPPPQEQASVIIPVTGIDHSVKMDDMLNLGLLLVAFGLIAAGMKPRRK